MNTAGSDFSRLSRLDCFAAACYAISTCEHPWIRSLHQLIDHDSSSVVNLNACNIYEK
jgi:hypothetical protein